MSGENFERDIKLFQAGIFPPLAPFHSETFRSENGLIISRY